MLEFFRRYQKFLFIVVTTVVVISFSFFGTYSLFTGQETKDRVAFVAIDGSKIYSSELNDLIRLISFDETPFQDGVVEKDILSSTVATNLVAPYLNEMQADLVSRHQKETHYTPYAHPQANYLSAEQVWTYFAPDLKKSYDELRAENNPVSQQAFQSRVKLYLAQKRFPSEYLQYFLRYQQKQHGELSEDPDLQHRDMALFGYHSIQDWFGPKFTTLSAKFIINAARIASQKGLTVTREETLRSIMENVHHNFKELIRRNREGMAYDNFNDYFQAELRKLGMDQSRLLKVWEDVLLFRRLMNETAQSVLVSDMPYRDFYRYMNEYVDAEIYKLPAQLETRSDRDLARLEIYLSAVRDPKTKNSLQLPTKIRDLSEIQKVYPELIQKRYRLQYAVCTKEQLAAKSSLKDTWNWELEESNFKKLVEKFPELGAKMASTREARERALDGLASKMRLSVDAYARSLIADEHPEWLQQALQIAPLQETVVLFREQGGKMPFQGVPRRKELMQILDSVPFNAQNPALLGYTQDRRHFYRIIVMERADKAELMTLKEAIGDGTLDKLLDKTLEASYPRQKQQKPSAFIKENGEFKPFQEVKDQLIEGNFQDLFQKLDQKKEELQVELPAYCNWADKNEARSAVRFYDAVDDIRKKCATNPGAVADLIFSKERAQHDPLVEQFKLAEITARAVRGEEAPALDVNVAFKTDVQALSPVNFSLKSGPVFFKVLSKGTLPADEAVFEKIFEVKAMLGQELKGRYTKILVADMQAKQALSLQE